MANTVGAKWSLTMAGPRTMNDSEYAGRWRGLVAQLRELERRAGIDQAADRWRLPAAPGAGLDRESDDDETRGGRPREPYSFALDPARRREIRAFYFGVADVALRRALISKQRELALFERTEIRTHLEDARRQLASLGRRPAEGWWIAAIVGATLVIAGYELFAAFGAIAGGVAALFVGNGIEQGARRRFENAVSSAREDSDAAAAAAEAAEQTRDMFSERESATGQADPASEAIADLGLKLH
jgi:hypothetical protein